MCAQVTQLTALKEAYEDLVGEPMIGQKPTKKLQKKLKAEKKAAQAAAKGGKPPYVPPPCSRRLGLPLLHPPGDWLKSAGAHVANNTSVALISPVEFRTVDTYS